MSEPRSSAQGAIVGNGRMGRALAAALPDWDGPFGRGFDGDDDQGREYDIVLLAVPDAQIGAAAAAIRPGHPGRLVGHTAGSIGLAPLAPHECFAMHPLMTVPLTGADFTGAGAAIAGSTPDALATARQLADRLGMHSVEIADADRAAYHAAASIASNFLVALEDAAETILATTGADRAVLIPIVRASLENWATHGGPTALTGPIARGDDATVARQRSAVAERAPALLEMFDSMCAVTRALARRRGTT